MSVPPKLEGAVPVDAGSGEALALAALTRRVAELEHRLDSMKIIVGLVLAAKVLLIGLFLYLVFGHSLVFRGGSYVRTTTRSADVVGAFGARPKGPS